MTEGPDIGRGPRHHYRGVGRYRVGNLIAAVRKAEPDISGAALVRIMAFAPISRDAIWRPPRRCRLQRHWKRQSQVLAGHAPVFRGLDIIVLANRVDAAMKRRRPAWRYQPNWPPTLLKTGIAGVIDRAEIAKRGADAKGCRLLGRFRARLQGRQGDHGSADHPQHRQGHPRLFSRMGGDALHLCHRGRGRAAAARLWARSTCATSPPPSRKSWTCRCPALPARAVLSRRATRASWAIGPPPFGVHSARSGS